MISNMNWNTVNVMTTCTYNMSHFTAIMDNITTSDINGHHFGFVLLILAAVLGGVALILGLIYAYIHCVLIRRRHHFHPDYRTRYYVRGGYAHNSGQSGNDQQGKAPIRTHPYLAFSSLSKSQKSTDQMNKTVSSSTKW